MKTKEGKSVLLAFLKRQVMVNGSSSDIGSRTRICVETPTRLYSLACALRAQVGQQAKHIVNEKTFINNRSETTVYSLAGQKFQHESV